MSPSCACRYPCTRHYAPGRKAAQFSVQCCEWPGGTRGFRSSRNGHGGGSVRTVNAGGAWSGGCRKLDWQGGVARSAAPELAKDAQSQWMGQRSASRARVCKAGASGWGKLGASKELRFTVATSLSRLLEQAAARSGTPGYRAPEVLLRSHSQWTGAGARMRWL